MENDESDSVHHLNTDSDDNERTEFERLLINMSRESGDEIRAINAADVRHANVRPDEGQGSVRRPVSSANPPTPVFVYVLTFLSAIGGFLFGYDTGVISGAIVMVSIRFSLGPFWQEVIVSIPMAAAAVFSLVSGVVNDRFGRKPTIIVASLIFTAGALLLALAQGKVLLVIGRLILGIGIGLASSTVPMYIAECAPSYLRGRLVTINNAFITGGQFVASLVAGGFSHDYENGWRFMFGLAAVPSIIQFFGFLFMPDTPRWLVTRGNHDKARAVLEHIHGRDFDIEQEIAEIETTVQESAVNDSRCVILKMLSTPHVRRALFIGCMLQMFQQIIGINTVMYYSATIIKMSGVESTSQAIWLASLTAGVNFIFTFVGLILVDRIGRRPLTLGSLIGSMGSLIVLAVGFQLSALNTADVTFTEVSNTTINHFSCNNYTTCNSCMMDTECGFCYLGTSASVHNGSCLNVLHDAYDNVIFDRSDYGRCNGNVVAPLHWAYGYCPTKYAWMATFGLILYLIFFAPGMGPMPWTINSEIYPLWARSTGNSVTTCVNWIANLIISMTFLSLTQAITRYGAFYLYAGCAAVGILFFALCLPETKGKHLEDVEQLFSKPLTSGCRDNTYERMTS